MRGRNARTMAAAAAALAVAAVGWKLVGAAAPGATRRAEEQRAATSPAPAGTEAVAAPVPSAGSAAAARSGAAARAPGEAPAAASFAPPRGEGDGAAASQAELDRAAAKLERRMKRFLSDLEYSPGLSEPPQQVVAPIPPPWTPDPALAGLPAPVIDEVSPRSAPEGAHVSIRGRNLRVAQVMFGGHPAEIVADADDHVTVLAPAGGHGAVPVAVTNVDGAWAIADEAFTYGTTQSH